MISVVLDLVPGKIPEIVRVSQYDKGLRTFEANLTYDGESYSISEDHRVVISGTKPDKKSFEYTCAFDDDTVTVVVTEQMSAVFGDVPCEITIYNEDGDRISSTNFILRVEKAAMDADAVTSETDIAAITELVTEAAANAIASKESANESAGSAEESKESAEASAGSAKDSAGSAVLSESWAIGGTGTREGEDENNAKYYAGLSSDSAKASSDSADESKKQAENSAESAEASSASAKESAQSASDSAGSAVLSESWAIGGTGTREDEDENNSKYYAEQSAGQAEAAKNSAEEAGNQAQSAENKAEAAAESAKEAAASAANFDDTDTTPEIEVTDFMSMIAADGNRYRKLVSDVAEAVIKKVSMTDLCDEEQTVQEAVNGLNGILSGLFGKDLNWSTSHSFKVGIGSSFIGIMDGGSGTNKYMGLIFGYYRGTACFETATTNSLITISADATTGQVTVKTGGTSILGGCMIFTPTEEYS